MLSPHHNHRVNGEKQKGRSQTRLLTGLLAATGWRSRPPCGPHPPCSAQTQGPDQTRWWWAGTAWAGRPSGTRRKAPMQGASQRSLHHGSHAHPNTLLSFWVLKGVSFPTNHWFHHKKMRRPHEIQLSKLRPLTDCRFLHGTCGLCSEWTRQGPARLFRNSEERGAHTSAQGYPERALPGIRCHKQDWTAWLRPAAWHKHQSLTRGWWPSPARWQGANYLPASSLWLLASSSWEQNCTH